MRKFNFNLEPKIPDNIPAAAGEAKLSQKFQSYNTFHSIKGFRLEQEAVKVVNQSLAKDQSDDSIEIDFGKDRPLKTDFEGRFVKFNFNGNIIEENLPK